jgi:hypothetical protein
MQEIAKIIIAVFFGCPGRGEKNGKLKIILRLYSPMAWGYLIVGVIISPHTPMPYDYSRKTKLLSSMLRKHLKGCVLSFHVNL